METPQGICRRVPPSNFHSGCCFCMASASHRAFSSAALAMRCARTLANSGGQARGVNTLPQKRRDQILGKSRPRAVDPLTAIKRILPHHALAPSVDALAVHSDEQDAPAIEAMETRLKEIDERQMNLTERDGFNLHSLKIVQVHYRVTGTP